MKKLFIILSLLFSFAANAQRILVNGFKHSSPPVTYATWNPSDINSNMVLTGGDLTIGGNGGGGFQMGRANTFLDGLDRQWEITINSGGSLTIGMALITEPLNAKIGTSAGNGGYGYTDGGQKITNNTPVAYGVGGYGTPGDKITVYWQGSTRSLGFKVNSTDYGFAFTSIPAGNYYPAISTGLSSYSYTANFGATAFSFPVSGYVGVY